METYNATATFMTPEMLLKHWQGHRGLTRRVIDAFPEEQLFNYSIGGMRTFALLAMEIIDLTNPGMDGIVSGQWKKLEDLPHTNGIGMPETKEEILALWDETTDKLNRLYNQLTPEQFHENTTAFGMYQSPVYSMMLYFIDNEIHHRGQGYVYLRALGIEPPAFWDR